MTHSPAKIALGWCFESIRITDKIVALSEWLRSYHYEPVWITLSNVTRYALALEGLTAHSINEFIPHESYLVVAENTPDRELQSDFRNDRISKRRLLNFPVAGDEEYIEACGYFLRRFWTSMMAAYCPDLVVNLNGQNGVSATLGRIAAKHDIPTVFFENGLLPDTLVLDPVGVNYLSHVGGSGWQSAVAPSPTAAEKQLLQDRIESITKGGLTMMPHGTQVGNRRLRQDLNISSESHIVLVPLQVDLDTNILFHSPVVSTMREFVTQVVAGLHQDGPDDCVLIIKEHPKRAPAGDPEIRHCCSERVKYVHDIDVTSLLEIADQVVCINTTVGLEAAIRGIPVVCLGRSAYSEKGFTTDAYLTKNPFVTVSQALATNRTGPDSDAVERFLCYILRNSLLPTGPTDPFAARAVLADRLLSGLKSGSVQTPDVSAELQKLLQDSIADNQQFCDKVKGNRNLSIEQRSENAPGSFLKARIEAGYMTPGRQVRLTDGSLRSRVANLFRIRTDRIRV